MYNQFLELLHNNQFASGGLLVGSLGVLIAYLRSLPGKIYDFFITFFSYSIEVKYQSALFPIVEGWLKKQSNSFFIRNFRGHYEEERSFKEKNSNFSFSPGYGRHFLFYQKTFISVSRTKDDQKTIMDSDTKITDDFVIRIYSRKKSKINKIFNEMVESSEEENKIRFYLHRESGYWSGYDRELSRIDKKIVLKKELLEHLEEDLLKFFNSEEKYRNLCIPYRRGYLFTGQPGNGKTSTIMKLASKYKANVYYLSLSNISNDQTLISLFQDIEGKPFVVIEDIDCIFKARKEVSTKDSKAVMGTASHDLFGNSENKSSITFSGLLNALDGIMSADSYVLMMSTNYPELLDPALLRPGRVDVQIEFTNADEYQAYELANKFFPDSLSKEEFSKLGGSGNHSMANLQEILLSSATLEDAIKKL